MSDLLRALDDDNISVLTLSDLSAAFDTIDHKIQLAGLENLYRISGTALWWFDPYLTGRTQMVTTDNKSSKPTSTTLSGMIYHERSPRVSLSFLLLL